MSDEPLPLPDEPALDPFEAELVAYLDGELDPTAARKVEARLAKDPAARARAAELKKSFDLLDYLPKPEPSPNFTTRTLDKLPAVQPSAKTGAAQPSAAARPVDQKSRPVPTSSAASTSMPVPLDTDDERDTEPVRRSRPFLRVAAIFGAVGLCVVLGYYATASVRPLLFPTREKEEEAKIEVEPRVVENLALYSVADDIAFVGELTKPEYFGDDPAVSFDPGLKIPAADTDKPTGKQFEGLAKTFRALPAARRTEIVKLDHDLHALDAVGRDRAFRALEAYAVWLERMPETERRGVTGAATSKLRLGVIRDIRGRQWLDSLPPPLRSKPELIEKWREDEAIRHERLAFIRQHSEAINANKSPWPFDTEAGRAAVIEYAKDVFKVDGGQKSRLSAEELAEYRRVVQVAQRDQAWAWYGLLVYELANHHPYLPEPDNPKLLLNGLEDLPGPVSLMLKKGTSSRLKALSGKWPEFPLQLHADILQMSKGGFVPPLGPARVDDFKPAVRTFAEKELFPKMSGEEKRELDRFRGRWPEYPQRFLQYAHKYDLPVPGVTLPFSPKKWDTTYGARPSVPK